MNTGDMSTGTYLLIVLAAMLSIPMPTFIVAIASSKRSQAWRKRVSIVYFACFLAFFSLLLYRSYTPELRLGGLLFGVVWLVLGTIQFFRAWHAVKDNRWQ